MFFNKDNKEAGVFQLLRQHTRLLEDCTDKLKETIDLFFEKKPEFESVSYEVHKIEHDADKIETAIKHHLFNGAFFVGLRSDFAELIHTLDDIAGCMVNVVRQLVEEKPEFPKAIQKDLLDVITETKKVFRPLCRSIKYLSEDIDKIEEYCKIVWETETKIDSMLHKIIIRLFASDIELARKLQLKDIFVQMAKISDKAEDAADIISVLAMNLNL